MHSLFVSAQHREREREREGTLTGERRVARLKFCNVLHKFQLPSSTSSASLHPSNSLRPSKVTTRTCSHKPSNISVSLFFVRRTRQKREVETLLGFREFHRSFDILILHNLFDFPTFSLVSLFLFLSLTTNPSLPSPAPNQSLTPDSQRSP